MKTGVFHMTLRLICCALVLFPHYALAGVVNIPGFKKTATPPLAAQLPVLQNVVKGATVGSPSENQLTIQQTEQQAIIDWSSFNIGAGATVQFSQQGKDQKGNAWVGTALNRIWSADPSLIYGNLTADGKIYLINQNGILFGPGSKVNVNSLVASALNIKDSDFLNNILHFKRENYLNPNAPLDPLAAVSNQGEINAANGGYVFLMAPYVENSSLINAPIGQIGLVAGTDVTLIPPVSNDLSRSGFYVLVNPADFNNPVNDPAFGNAVNQPGGELRSDGGMAGMYGNNIDQWGVIRAVTAFQNSKGQVELRAANRITTHENSSITLPVDASLDPKTGHIQTVDDTFDIQPNVDIRGLQTQNSEGGINDVNPARRIELMGSILAPTGIVAVNAADRVFLGAGSSIDVSGVTANDLPLPLLTDLKLNSVELRDAYAQKDGVLQGEKITTSETSGSNIGDISQAILTQPRTALERSIGGAMTRQSDGTYKVQSGSINLSAASGDIIVKQGALFDISGGAVNYVGGMVNSTKLLSGMKIYDISNAPLNIHYDKVLGNYEKTYDRFGVRESYSGLYYRGASPLKTYMKGYTQGGDAGRLTLAASTVLMDGQINAGVTRGLYQNMWTPGNTGDAMALSKARGLELPRAGTLSIQNASSISVEAEPAQQSGSIESDPVVSPLQTGPTVLSTKTLNEAKLGSLDLNATHDIMIKTAPDGPLILQPGGAFSARAPRIDHEGSIKVPSGSIDMSITSSAPVDQRIVIGSQSSLDVSGERIDNTRTTDKGAYLNLGKLDGGSITIKDMTENGAGVFMTSGAVVDVSGGYRIDQKGKITGGNAGSLDIQGVNIMLEGELRGYALADPNGKLLGGKITLTSANIDDKEHNGIFVTPATSIPQWFDWNKNGFDPSSSDPGKSAVPVDMKGKLYLAADAFDKTGFTQITLNSMNNVTVDGTIRPSLVRLNSPVSMQQAGSPAPAQAQQSTGSPVSGHPELVRLDDSHAFMAGPSSFSAAAGVTFSGGDSTSHGNLNPVTEANSEAKIAISEGAGVSTTPNANSRISLTAALSSIDMAGALNAPGGKITLSSGLLTVEAGAKISAAGYNRPDPASTPKGYDMNYQPVKAGSIVLSAGGDLVLSSRSSIDISGSPEVASSLKTTDDKIVTFREAGDPGSLSLSYHGILDWQPDAANVLTGHKDSNGVKGGSLTIFRTDEKNGLDVRQADMKRYRELGFDDLTLKSPNSLLFKDDMDVSLGRKLTLDAPEIQGAGNSSVALRAPWIVLTNTTRSPAPDPSSTANSSRVIELTGEWIDVIGSLNFSGFKDVTLDATRDIRLSEALYINNDAHSGKLAVTGNLKLDADRIYPGNFNSFKDNATYPNIYSDFSVHSDGKVTILNSGASTDSPIYSAGGSLTVVGLKGIDVEKGGTLAAPLGNINLSAPGQRIYLADGSVLTTAGNTEVNFGGIDPSNIWVNVSKTNPGDLVFNSDYFTADSLPRKGITLDADTIVAMKGSNGSQGSVIDVSGSGSVFAYKFQPGVEGSIDPLSKPNRYVAVKSDVFPLPGQTVDLKGAGLKGTYTLLPLDSGNPQNARYAFMPDAYIIEVQSGAVLPGTNARSQDGHPLAIGYTAVADTSIAGTRPQIYSVRTAAEVLKTEGNYVKQSLISGDGGNFNATGSAIVLDGSLKGSALMGYQGGTIGLSSPNIIVQTSGASPLSSKFGFEDSLNSDLKDKLVISGDTVKGFREVELGDVNPDPTKGAVTNSIVVKAGAELNADIISLAALKTTTDPKTTKNIEPSITLEAARADKAGAKLTATSGDGLITLKTPGGLLIGSDAVVHASHSISLDVNNVQGLQGKLQVDNSALTLKSNSIIFGNGMKGPADTGLYLTADELSKITGFDDMTFASKTDIQFRDDFTLSASDSLTLDAARIIDTNTNGPSHVALNSAVVNLKNSGAASLKTSANTGTFTVDRSDQINIGGGDVQFSGFNAINLASTNDLTLKGKGSLITNNADLNIKTARVATGADSNGTKQYIAPNFVLDAGSGVITMNGSGATAATSPAAGGLLEIKGRRIDLATVLQSDGGTVKLATSGSNVDGIFLNGGRILARGTEDAPGGNVILSADYVDGAGIAQSGAIKIDAGSGIDVSAGKQGDAGLISLRAPVGGVTISGDLQGTAQDIVDSQGNIARKGKGGSFILHTDRIDDLAGLNSRLTAGGFNESLDLRARSGNIDIGADQTLKAHHVKLTADDNTTDGSGILLNAKINVAGTIDADSADGSGRVELYANGDLNAGGTINVRGTNPGAKGGDVTFSSSQGFINVNPDGTIDVSGGAGGTGGTIYLRAQRNLETGSDAKMRIAPGTLAGQTNIFAEAFWVYPGVALIDDVAVLNWQTQTGQYMLNAATVKDSIIANGSTLSGFHLLPGIEVRNAGDMTLAAPWDLTAWRDGGEPGVLTIRAAGNLNIGQNLTDHPTTLTNLNKLLDQNGNSYDFTARNSWGFNLVAGADLTGTAGSADYLAVVRGKGDLNLLTDPASPSGPGTLVYTESAPINFASGSDIVIGSGIAARNMINNFMKYNLATYDGPIHGNVGRDLIINGGAVQTATGDIGIHVGRDLQLNADSSNNLGAIRTTGRLSSTKNFGNDDLDPVAPVYVDPDTGKPLVLAAPQSTPIASFYWRYIEGGNIALDAGRSVGKNSGSENLDTAVNSSQWDSYAQARACLSGTGTCGIGSFNYAQFSANYGSSTVQATGGLAAMGGGDLSIRTGGDFLAQAGTFGKGNLTIHSGGDVKGRFLNKDGHGDIRTLGNFGAFAPTSPIDSNGRVQVELFNSQTAITALGEMQIGAIVNPDLASGDIASFRSNFVKCSYTPDTEIRLQAGGDVTMAGVAPFYHQKNTANSNNKGELNEIVLPATVSIDAGGDINLLNNFTLASAPLGNLRLWAGGDIKGSALNQSPVIMMSDIAPEYWYRSFYVRGTSEAQQGGWIASRISTNTDYLNFHGFYKTEDADKQATAKPLHSDDGESIKIHSDGDIKDVIFYLPKKAELTAGRDITDIVYEGQNINPDDVSMIKAGRDISMKYVKDTGTAATEVTEALHNGLVQGGPGTFLVQAGGSIDLGTLRDGLQAVGNGNNPMLGTGKSSLIVMSGYDPNKSVDAATFFNEIRESGDLYGMLLSGGKREDAEKLCNAITTKEAKDAVDKMRVKAGSEDEFFKMLTSGGNSEDAAALLQDTRTRTIGSLTPSGIGTGDINMTSTQIATSIGKSDIYVIARGDLNLGKTALPVAGAANKKTGITTGGGGGINIFAVKDINVQESRVMTFFSKQDVLDPAVSYGDITVWSDQGSINAGRGSRSAVSASPPKKILLNGGYITVFTPPAVGSGIRAAVYGDNPPLPGNIHLFAPSGVIDAGEAGIAGNSLFLAALKVTNAANISFSAGSIGVPQQSAATTNIGALSGAGGAMQNSQLTSDVSGVGVAKSQASQMVENIIAKWLDVKVIDFVDDGNNDGNNN